MLESTDARCSFCQKERRDAGPLVAGAAGVYIFGACIESGRSLVRRQQGPTASPSRRLAELAHGRSGDKGNHANIGVACRNEEAYRYLEPRLTADRVAKFFRTLNPTRVERFELPKIFAYNFVLYDVLDGGASRSLRIDSQGKTLALQLLEMELADLEER